MKHVPLAQLENAIIKPGIEKHLVPLLHFKGHANLGRMHRWWNLIVSMQAHEAETMADGYARLWGNPDYAHLCLPDKRPQTTGFYGFLSRLQAKPDVAANQPGLLEYARHLMPRPFQLVPVSEFYTDASHASRFAWWRSLDPDIAAAREAKRQRREARIAEKSAAREERVARRAERRLMVLRHREEAAQRRSERRTRTNERNASEAARRARNTLPRQAAYPYIIHAGGRAEHPLLRAINDAVPRQLMGDLRADICQDLAVGILCGDFAEDDLRLPAKEIIKRMRKLFPEKYGPLSLDAIVPGTDNLRLIDTI